MGFHISCGAAAPTLQTVTSHPSPQSIHIPTVPPSEIIKILKILKWKLIENFT